MEGMTGVIARGVAGEYDPCEMDEDLLTNMSNSTSALDSTSDSSATTTTLPIDMDVLMESDTVTSMATLKQTNIKQNGGSKTMSIAHSYNYTGKQAGRQRHRWLLNFSGHQTNKRTDKQLANANNAVVFEVDIYFYKKK